jgi:hypothetical protein
VAQAEFLDLLSSDPQLKDVYEFAGELGAMDMSTPVRLRFTDGSETLVVPMMSPVPDEMAFVLKLSGPRDASLLLTFDDSGVSLFNRQGGLSYGSEIGDAIFWGDAGSCMRADCIEACFEKKIGEWLGDMVVDNILNYLFGGLWDILKSGVACRTWIDCILRSCDDPLKSAVECLSSLPLVGYAVDIEACVIECLFNPSAYAGPNGTCEPPTNGDEGGPTIAVAHDPNRKFGPHGNVAAGQKLDYKVEYENEGEGSAFAVFVTDTLDESLDESTLKIGPVMDVATDKQIGGVGTYNPGTRTITWFVGQVDPGQGGYAEFSVNVRADAPAGAEIINVGTVYFPSALEETKTNTIVSTVAPADSVNAVDSPSIAELSLLARAWLESDRVNVGW